MKPDPVREHLDTRSERGIEWHIQFLPGTRARLLRRAVTTLRPALTPQQLDVAVMRAEGELASYRVALMMIEGMGRTNRREREERASQCVTAWSVAFAGRQPEPGPGVYTPPEQAEYPGCTVTA